MRIPRGTQVVRNRQTSSGRVETQQTQGAVSGFSGAMGLVKQYKDQEDQAKTQEAINTALKKSNEWKVQNMTRQGKAAEGMTEEYLKFSQDLESELSQNLSTNARERFSQWSFAQSEQDKMTVIGHQHKQSMLVKQAAFEEGVTLSQEMIRQDAKQWQPAMAHLENSLDLGLNSGVIAEAEYETKKTELTNKMRTELGRTYYTQDKHDFIKNIDQFGFGKAEIEAYKNKYQNDLAAEERERKSLFTEEAKLLFGKRDDMKAQAVANGDSSHFFEGAEKLRKMGFNDWASQLEEDGTLYKKVISFNDSNKNKPLREIVQEAEKLSVGNNLDGSSVEYKSMQAIQTEVKKQAKIFDADPAEYVGKWAQGETMEEIVESRMSLQKGQGFFPSKGYMALTQNEKKNFVGAWEGGNITEKTELVLNSFRYGKHTPKVLDEVGVNSALALAPMIGFDQTTGVDKKSIELLVAGVADKAELLDDSKKADYRASAQSSEFYQALVKIQQKFPTNEDLPRRIADVEKAMIGIGARMVDTEAGSKFFDDKIDTMDSGDKLIYFPKSLDSDEVESSLDQKKEEITKRFLTGDKQRDTQAKWALRDAVWVNTSQGFVLADSRSGAYIEGSQVDMLELEPIKKDLAKKKMMESGDLQTVTFMRR